MDNKEEPVKVAILYDYTPEKDQDTVLKEFADKMSKQEDIPKDIQAVVNKRFWDMLDTPEKEPQEDQEDIFDEVFCRYFDIIYRERKSMHDAVRELMDLFTITRKQ